jgi:hypothetical protein
MDLCIATTATDLGQATAIKEVLEEAGVASHLRGGLHDAYPGTSGLGAIDVLVDEGDLQTARDVLARAEEAALDFEAEEET